MPAPDRTASGQREAWGAAASVNDKPRPTALSVLRPPETPLLRRSCFGYWLNLSRRYRVWMLAGSDREEKAVRLALCC